MNKDFMNKYMKKYNPFRIYRANKSKEGKNFIDISLKGFQNSPFGWQWGNDGEFRFGDINIHIFGLDIIYFEKFRGGFDIRILGFWWIK